jgi:hypothetical protein
LHDIVLKIPILFSFFLLIDFSGIAQSPWKSFWNIQAVTDFLKSKL